MSVTIQIDGNESIITKALAILSAMPGLQVQTESTNLLTSKKLPTEQLLRAINEGKSGRVIKCKNVEELMKNLNA